MHGVTMKFTSS